MKRKKYISPLVAVCKIFVENSVATGSFNDFTVGGNSGNGYPDIEDAGVEEDAIDFSL
ncbi:hypothetical protein [Sphingobacterium composti Ten et al. 2007 non Yoo et al. 2007]|uniref:hypothetical protein n=1 Tax=Sphingobacterium composti TaxID=363260 RepID=UPI00135B0B61|nr:hypothetical protein [Sphingobacterium composti Ten et al. 2007 non Yoo et al. 2007]